MNTVGKHLDSSVTFPLTIVNQTAYVSQIAFCCSVSGSVKVRIQDGDSPPKILAIIDLSATGPTSNAMPAQQMVHFDEPVPMLNKIEIPSVTLGTAVVDIWISFDAAPA